MVESDRLVEEFIENNYPGEAIRPLLTVLTVLDEYNLVGYRDELMNIISVLDDRATETIRDQVYLFLISKLDYLLKESGMVVNLDETNYTEMTTILQCLQDIQDLDDYLEINLILESADSPLKQIIAIINSYSDLTESDLYRIIVSFDPRMLGMLKSYIDQTVVLDDEEKAVIDPDFIKTIRSFKDWCDSLGIKPIGIQLMEDYISPLQALDQYISLLDGFDEKSEHLVYEIYSVLIISKEGYSALIPTYRKYSSLLLISNSLPSKIYEQLVQASNAFQLYRENQKNESL